MNDFIFIKIFQRDMEEVLFGKNFASLKKNYQKYLKSKIKFLFLFGTIYTMNCEYLEQKFSENNIVLNLPTDADQAWIDNFRKTVYAQKTSSEEILYFQQLIKKYSAKSPVVIACTELSLFALKNDESCIDMADLQIEEFLR